MVTEPITGGIVFKIVESIARFFSLFRKHKTEKLEDEILEFMAQERDWQSAKSI
jgi:predicted nucleotidyltransferase